MPAQCPRCGSSVGENDLPRLQGVEVRCPKCGEPMVVPEMTMPFAAGGGAAAAVPTLVAQKGSGGSLAAGKRYALVVLSGKDSGKVIAIEKARVTLGRSDCDIVLDDGELSRQHALIAIEGTTARLEDLDSTNGTFVGDERINQAPLEDRSEFRIGSHQLLFVMSDADGPPPAAPR